MRAAYLTFAIAVAGCGGPTPFPVGDAGAPVDEGPGGGDSGTDGGALWQGMVKLPFDGELHWSDGVTNALGPVAAANFSGGVGTIVYHGQTIDAAIYQEIPFAPYDLAAIVATTASNIIVLYGYCQNGGINNWYYESLDEPVTEQGVLSMGTCSLAHTATTADMIFTVWNGPPNDLQHVTNATVTGANVMIDNGLGSATIGGQTYDVVAFDWVDCSGCGSGGWYELHSLLRKGPQVSFGIFYLINSDTASVSFEYAFRFDVPTLNAPPIAKLPATWVIH